MKNSSKIRNSKYRNWKKALKEETYSDKVIRDLYQYYKKESDFVAYLKKQQEMRRYTERIQSTLKNKQKLTINLWKLRSNMINTRYEIEALKIGDSDEITTDPKVILKKLRIIFKP